MRICVVSTGRAGSTSLYNLIKDHLGSEYYTITEPFNEKIGEIKPNQFEIITENVNVLIKTITNQKPIDKTDEFIDDWIFDFFDKVILLDRLNQKEQVESFAYLTHTNNKFWHTKQVYRMSVVPEEIINEWQDKLLYSKKTINDYSKKHNKKIYYYEDIFINKNTETIKEIFEYLEIDLKNELVDEWIFSEEKKVRINEINRKLL